MKNEKGITLMVLVTTIIILLILSGITIYGINLASGKEYKDKMFADIAALKDSVMLYYNKYGEIPKTNRSIELFEQKIEYWEIDLSKLDGITLNFGREYRTRR